MNKNYKRNLDILTAYISTFHSLKCDGSGHFTTWSDKTMKSGAIQVRFDQGLYLENRCTKILTDFQVLELPWKVITIKQYKLSKTTRLM